MRATTITKARRGRVLGGACTLALAALLTPTAFVPEAEAVECVDDVNFGAGTFTTAGDDGGVNTNTSCGQGSDASGIGTLNTAIGSGANSSGDDSVNTSTGADAKSLGEGSFNTATGADANAVGDSSQNTATGSGSNASGSNSQNTATGYQADANGAGSSNIAFGSGATASGASSTNTAIGMSSLATSNGVAIGANTKSTGGTAVGNGALASATGAVAIGLTASATGANAIAIGSDALATGSIAVGNGASAGNGGAAFGDFSTATGTNSTAVGPNTTVAYKNAAAFGNGATATRANQQVFGTSSNTYTMPGLTSSASKAAQGSPTHIVTSNAAGDLAAYTPSELGIATKGDLAKVSDEKNSGVALAIAMQNPDLAGSERFGMAANWGAFENANALGMSLMGVLGHDFVSRGDRVALSGGFGVGFETGNGDSVYGGRVGLQWTH